jgi:hypothetical protein
MPASRLALYPGSWKCQPPSIGLVTRMQVAHHSGQARRTLSRGLAALPCMSLHGSDLLRVSCPDGCKGAPALRQDCDLKSTVRCVRRRLLY